LKIMDDVKLMTLAKGYCLRYHENQFRKNGEPYHNHPIRVQEILKKYGYDDVVTQCVALLHDVFEDTKIIRGRIKEEFGYEIANGVYVLSRNTISIKERDVILNIMGFKIKDLSKDITPREIVERLYKARLTFARSKILRVKIADMIDNTRDFGYLHITGIKRKIEDAKNFYIPLGKEIAPEMTKELEKNIEEYEKKTKGV